MICSPERDISSLSVSESSTSNLSFRLREEIKADRPRPNEAGTHVVRNLNDIDLEFDRNQSNVN